MFVQGISSAMTVVGVLLVFGILPLVQGQVLVDKTVHAWLGSDVYLKCNLVSGDVRQITWRREENGQNVDFLTYSFSEVKKLTPFSQTRVDFLGNGSRDGMIRIRDVTLTDEGVYTCIFAIFPTGPSPNTTSLYVFAKPNIRLQPLPDPVVAKLPYQTVAVCVAEGAKPAANITWRTGDLDYKTSEGEMPNNNGTVTTQSQLQMIPGAGIKDHSVTCIISQNNGTSLTQTKRNLTLQNIQYPPDSVRVEVKTLDNGAIQFNCAEDSNPPATSFIWKRQETFDSDVTIELGYERSLQSPNFPNGLYSCEVTNAIGKSSGYVYLYPVTDSSTCLHGCLWPWLILLVAFGVFIWWHYKKKSSGMKKNSDEKHEVKHVDS